MFGSDTCVPSAISSRIGRSAAAPSRYAWQSKRREAKIPHQAVCAVGVEVGNAINLRATIPFAPKESWGMSSGVCKLEGVSQRQCQAPAPRRRVSSPSSRGRRRSRARLRFRTRSEWYLLSGSGGNWTTGSRELRGQYLGRGALQLSLHLMGPSVRYMVGTSRAVDRGPFRIR